MGNLPTGTVTFLFTDIEGSTTRWERHPASMQDAVARHDTLLKAVMDQYRGSVFKTVGDAFYVAFSSAHDALAAALAAQQALYAEVWPAEIAPLRVRMALHTGEAEQRGNDYFGQALNRVARILSAGHGGQVLLSRATLGFVRDHTLPEITFRDLGMHHLKDIQHPMQIFQLLHAEMLTDFPPLKTLNLHPTNMPPQLTPCIGRETELTEVSTLLQHPRLRLVTLIGPGGIGKTRLGLQVAANLAASFPDGLWFVELATIHSAEEVGPAILHALGHREAETQPILEQLKTRLDGQTLLFLDSFEQVSQASPFISDLLNSCPRLKIIITSRLALELGQEHVYHVIPLAVPDARQDLEPDALLNYGAIALFVQRASLAKPSFHLTKAAISTVIKICTRLDGLPLAIELVAARTAILSLQAILKRLEHQMQFFAGGEKRHSTQQQTLRGTIEWSYNLLTAHEKMLLTRLALFKSGCTFEAIEAICASLEGPDFDLLALLNSLTDKSLLRQLEGENGEPRFRVMYIIREYALEQLRGSHEWEELGQQHAEYYLALAEQIAPTLTGLEQKSALATLEEEHENVQAALAWEVGHGQIERGLRMAEALGRFWWMHGHGNEGRKWLEKLLTSEQAETAPALLRTRALVMSSRLASSQHEYALAAQLAEQALASSLVSEDQKSICLAYSVQAEVAFHRGEYAQATNFLQKSLAIQRILGDKRGCASLLNNLGNVALQQEKLDQAAKLQEESLVLFRQVGDSWAIATVLTSLGEIERRRRNYKQATVLYEESLRLCRTLGNREGIATALVSLGDLARFQAHYIQATNLYKKSLVIFRELENKIGITVCLQGLAEIAYEEKQLEQATRLFAQAEVTAYAMDTTTLHYENETHRTTIAHLRATLTEGLFEGIWMAGQAMTLEQVSKEALGEEFSDQNE